MPTIKKVFLKIRNAYEIGIPCVAFCILFIAFIWQIVSRYIFDHPISWSNEVVISCYISTVFLAACFIRRIDKHIRFSVVYDRLNPKSQRRVRIFANLIVVVTFAILLPYTVKYLLQDKMITPVFNIRRSYVFSPIIMFILTAVLYSLPDLYHDVLAIIRHEPPSDPRLPIEVKVEEEII